jgi:glutamate carboxypeptidase
VSRLSYRPAWAPREADLALATTLAELAGRLTGAAGLAGTAGLAGAAGLVASDPGAPAVTALPAPRPAAGAADTNFLGNLDIAVVDGFGPQGGAAHARGEHVIVASLWQRITLLAAFLTAA